MNENLYIVSAYGDYCGVDAATLISIPDEHCCDAEAIEDYLNADPDLCVKADARLIAAAPDMLAALEAAARFIADEVEQRGLAGSDMSDYQDEAVQALDRVEAAIAKAKGA